MTKFINVGHRGASAYAPENTIASFEEAIARNADMIEFDIRRTSDGVLVVHHDRIVRTSAGTQKPVSRLTFGELSQLAAACNFTLTTFSEVLEVFGNRIPMNIEIKAGGFERQIVKELRRHRPAFAPTVSSFFPWVIARAKSIDGSLKTGLVLGRERFMNINLLAPAVAGKLAWILGVAAMHLDRSITSPDVVKNLSRLGLTVFIWTVDNPEEMRRLIGMGVDGIITNKPDLLYQTCLELARPEKPVLRSINDSFGRFAYAV